MKKVKILGLIIITIILFSFVNPKSVMAEEYNPLIEYSIENNNTKVELKDNIKILNFIKIYLPENTSGRLKKNNETYGIYNNETLITEEGKYILKVIDELSNVEKLINFEIDKSDPEFYFEVGGFRYENSFPKGTYYQNITFYTPEEGAFFKVYNKDADKLEYMEKDGSTNLGSGYELSTTGYYSLQICEERENGRDKKTYCTSQTKYIFFLDLETDFQESSGKNYAIIIFAISSILFVGALGLTIYAYKVKMGSKSKKGKRR